MRIFFPYMMPTTTYTHLYPKDISNGLSAVVSVSPRLFDCLLWIFGFGHLSSTLSWAHLLRHKPRKVQRRWERDGWSRKIRIPLLFAVSIVWVWNSDGASSSPLPVLNTKAKYQQSILMNLNCVCSVRVKHL